MVVTKWLNRTTEVVEVVRHYTEHVNTPLSLLALFCLKASTCLQTLQLVQNTSGIVSDSNFLRVHDVTADGHVTADGNLDQLRCSPVFRDLGTEEKREGCIF